MYRQKYGYIVWFSFYLFLADGMGINMIEMLMRDALNEFSVQNMHSQRISSLQSVLSFIFFRYSLSLRVVLFHVLLRIFVGSVTHRCFNLFRCPLHLI